METVTPLLHMESATELLHMEASLRRSTRKPPLEAEAHRSTWKRPTSRSRRWRRKPPAPPAKKPRIMKPQSESTASNVTANACVTAAATFEGVLPPHGPLPLPPANVPSLVRNPPARAVACGRHARRAAVSARITGGWVATLSRVGAGGSGKGARRGVAEVARSRSRCAPGLSR